MTKTVTRTRRSANHNLHLTLSILSCGMWAVTGWPIAAALGRRTKTTTETYTARATSIPAGWYQTPDGFGVKYWNGSGWAS